MPRGRSTRQVQGLPSAPHLSRPFTSALPKGPFRIPLSLQRKDSFTPLPRRSAEHGIKCHVCRGVVRRLGAGTRNAIEEWRACGVPAHRCAGLCDARVGERRTRRRAARALDDRDGRGSFPSARPHPRSIRRRRESPREPGARGAAAHRSGRGGLRGWHAVRARRGRDRIHPHSRGSRTGRLLARYAVSPDLENRKRTGGGYYGSLGCDLVTLERTVGAGVLLRVARMSTHGDAFGPHRGDVGGLQPPPAPGRDTEGLEAGDSRTPLISSTWKGRRNRQPNCRRRLAATSDPG